MRRFAAIAAMSVFAASTAMPAFAEGWETSGWTTITDTKAPMRQGQSRRNLKAVPVRQTLKREKKEVEKAVTVDLTCMQTAVATREAALSGAFGAFSSGISTAYATRASALQTAWATTDAASRKAAIQTAWDVFGTSVKRLRETMKAAKQDAWKTFRTSAKACGGEPMEDAGEGIDGSL